MQILFSRTKKHNFSFVFSLLLLGILFLIPVSHASYNYTPLESVPGFEGTSSDLKGFIESIYQFGIWTVGIAAVLMLTIGGFMYMVSAGNTSKTGIAKGIITDAILGLIIALGAYLILYVINPDLVKITLSMRSLGTGISTDGGGTGGGGGSGSGKCEPVKSGPCSVENLKTKCFGEANAEKASSICNAESGGVETKPSGADICRPSGPSVSWGLFQFNLTANNMGGLNCPRAFDRMYTGRNKQCSVVNQDLYNRCVAAAKNPENNIQAACSLSRNGTRWSAWGANRKCGF